MTLFCVSDISPLTFAIYVTRQQCSEHQRFHSFYTNMLTLGILLKQPPHIELIKEVSIVSEEMPG